ncbi:MAG: hypothetical protein ACP5I8_13540, partial [Phycisphaerae bacterium]
MLKNFLKYIPATLTRLIGLGGPVLAVELITVFATGFFSAPAASASAAPGVATEPWAKPHIPSSPVSARTSGGGTLEISGPGEVASGGTLRLRVTLVNRGGRFLPLAGSVPVWLNFPGTWCWGPNTVRATRLLRSVGEGYRTPQFTSRVAAGAPPGARYALVPLNVSHIFDLSLPGKYKAQLAGMGMI